MNPDAMTDEELYEEIANAVISLPYAGKGSAGNQKTTGRCPRCNAGPLVYRHEGRFKFCHGCGYDKSMERVLVAYRSVAKRGGRDLPRRQLINVVSYYRRVYE